MGGGTHRFLGSRIILYGRTDDPQRLHFHVVRGRGEQALQRLPHAELFEIFTKYERTRIFHIGVRVRVRWCKACPSQTKPMSDNNTRALPFALSMFSTSWVSYEQS